MPSRDQKAQTEPKKAKMNRRKIRYHARATLRHARRTKECAIELIDAVLGTSLANSTRYDPVVDVLHHYKADDGTPGHPTELCDCVDGPFSHKPTCTAFPFLCEHCTGSGHCSMCQGDGCNKAWDRYEPEPKPLAPEEAKEVHRQIMQNTTRVAREHIARTEELITPDLTSPVLARAERLESISTRPSARAIKKEGTPRLRQCTECRETFIGRPRQGTCDECRKAKEEGNQNEPPRIPLGPEWNAKGPIPLDHVTEPAPIVDKCPNRSEDDE